MSILNNKKEHPDSSTQRYLPFSGIKENIILMKDDSARIVLKCSAINFLLKSSDEQDSIIISFQRFLNSLSFPIQIMVRSKKLDIDSYLSNLNSMALKQENNLLQEQTYEYIAYLKKLIEVAQIMRKDFYIVIPFDEEQDASVKDDSLLGPFKSFWKSINQQQTVWNIKNQLKQFNKMKKELAKKVNWIQTSLENMWVKAEVISKQELVSFLTDYYNPRMDSLASIPWDVENYNLNK